MPIVKDNSSALPGLSTLDKHPKTAYPDTPSTPNTSANPDKVPAANQKNALPAGASGSLA